MTQTTVTVGSFFPFSPLTNNVPFVPCLPCFYLFMKISTEYWPVVIFYVPLSFFLSCFLSLSLPQPGKPAKWVEFHVSHRFRFEVRKNKSQSQPDLFLLQSLRGRGVLRGVHMLYHPLLFLTDHPGNLPPLLFLFLDLIYLSLQPHS